MGCSSSKLDDLPAVALCRERCAFLDEAIHLRYSFAEAHIAYIQSLKVIGHSLHNFIEQSSIYTSGSSPKLNLPPQKKGESIGKTSIEDSISPPQHLPHSNSGSHLHFDSDSDEESGSLHNSDQISPLHGHIDYMGAEQDGPVSYPGGEVGGYMHMNYMKNKATPSVVYEQKPMSQEKVYHMGESSSSSTYSYPYSNVNSNPYPYNGYPNYGGGFNGYYGNSPPSRGYGSMLPAVAPPASTSKPSPPPPPPSGGSAWDFLNLFDTSDKYYSAYTPSWNSKEVREEEGIPHLEDEDYQNEVVKEVHGDQKFVDDHRGGNHAKSAVNDEFHDEDDDEDDDDADASLYHAGPSNMAKNDGMEYDVHIVDKKVVDNEKRSEERGKGVAFKAGSRDVYEAVREIEIQFETASKSGNEIAKMLEVGKLPYQRKHVSKLLHSVTLSLPVVTSQPSTSNSVEPSSSNDKAGSSQMDFVEDVRMRSLNLSSTLQKLYLWEKKLYNEVKAEEKMRVSHDQKCRKLKRLDERGAEAQKIDATRTLVRSLSTRIKISIQVVDKISVTISKIRDEELWPQLNELIQGLTRMWRCMLECHRTQYQAMREAKNLGSIGSGKKLGDGHLGAILQLEHELVNWTFNFSNWISAQKGYVKALNNWLLKCLLYEPEETPDGIAPFSPSRIGAPPVFVICNQWSQALETLSEKEVVDSMRVFATSLLQRWEREKLEMHQRMLANKDLERKVRNLDREDQKIHKKIQALDKIILVSGDGSNLPVTGNIVYQSDTSNSSLHVGLQRIFEAMERFTENSMKVYEELLQRSEEVTLTRGQEVAS